MENRLLIMGKRFAPKFHNSKVCYRCHNKINEHDNYCTLVSHSQGKIVHQDNWHADCWKEHVQEWVIKSMTKLSQEAIQMVPGAAEFLKRFQQGGATPAIVN